ncbi:hypothetical protein EV426DRAFT_669157 [Tirmania nivea]|nr:hypothetical protein EV426DRAFT_669157 [Tirmania nivea]
MDTIEEIFENDPPQRKCVHIVIKVPEMDKNLSQILLVSEMKKEFMIEIAMFQVSWAQYRNFLSSVGIRKEAITIQHNSTAKTISEFNWGPGNEASYADAYTAWLSDIVTIPERMELYCFKGTVDIAIVQSPYVKCYDIASGIRMGIELKRVFVLLDHQRRYPRVLTALAEYLSGSGGADPGVVGPEHILALPKVDIMKWLPSPAIGDMRDFFDEMSERERREWNARYALNYVMQTPAFNSMYA